MSADREAAIREHVKLRSDPSLAETDAEWLLAELAAAREREEQMRWWLDTRPGNPAGLPVSWAAWNNRVSAALSEGEG